MKPILKKILSYIAIAFLGFATGVGCLIGVSSCSSQYVDDQQEKQLTEIPKKYLRVYEGELDSTHTYFIVAKNYSTNGEGAFYQGSITLENSVSTSVDGAYNFEMNITLIRNNNYILGDRYFTMTSKQSGGLYHLRTIYIDGVGFIYQAEEGLFNRSMCSFTFKDARILSGNVDYLYYLFNVYDLNEPRIIFDFGEQFNYNNFYQVGDNFLSRGQSPVVNAVGNTAQTKTYNIGWFRSGQFVFNTIKAYYYVTAYNYFQTHDNEWVKFESNAVNNYYLYFYKMEYYNEATEFSVTACNRITIPHPNEAGWTDVYLNVAWTSTAYQRLELQSSIQNVMNKNVMESIPSEALAGFVEVNSTTNVGLGDVFSLISLAFSSWIPIFQIEIVPGITIGLLLFLPLISGIIILIIWIVKR